MAELMATGPLSPHSGNIEEAGVCICSLADLKVQVQDLLNRQMYESALILVRA